MISALIRKLRGLDAPLPRDGDVWASRLNGVPTHYIRGVYHIPGGAMRVEVATRPTLPGEPVPLASTTYHTAAGWRRYVKHCELFLQR